MITAAPHRRRLLRSLAVLLWLCAWCAHAGTLRPWAGGATPELRAKTLAGDEVHLSDFAGRVVIVNFWATWCAPCVAEMPSLQRLRDRLAAQGVEVIAVNFQENAARIQPFLDRLGLTFPVVRDHDGRIRTAWQVNVFPTTYVVGPDGRIALVAIGEIDWDDPRVESRVRGLSSRPRSTTTSGGLMDRRSFVATAAAVPLVAAFPRNAGAQARTYAPASTGWRTFEVTTRLEVANAGPGTRAWVPVPMLDNDWQQSLPSTFSGNMREAALATDPASGAQMVRVAWADTEKSPQVEVVSRIRARDRRNDWASKARPAAPANLAADLKPTALIPIDGIVATTAAGAVAGKTSDLDRARALYDWVVNNTYRDPAVKGCGVGDIKGMLETKNMGGKCADLNALFVGLCRAAGIPARDIYGIRVAKSAFGYKELGAGSPDITKAQHCRAEVWLADYGWVAMDPADVAKVMRQETPEWIKDPRNEVAAPVYSALFGAWEGNWMGYNAAHDVVLPGSAGPRLGFFMYPQAETRNERVDSLDPDTFKYKITVREIAA